MNNITSIMTVLEDNGLQNNRGRVVLLMMMMMMMMMGALRTGSTLAQNLVRVLSVDDLGFWFWLALALSRGVNRVIVAGFYQPYR